MRWWKYRPLLIVLGASFALRLVLMARGGLHYHPDEYRYNRAIEWLHLLLHDGPRAALRSLFLSPEHNGFTLLATVPAALQGLVDLLFGLPPERTMWLGAVWLSLFGVGCLLLLFLLARRVGCADGEALLAVVLMALSVSMTRYSRHLLPYDAALFLTLLALLLTLRPRSGPWTSLGCGLLLGATFLVYNAAWLPAALVGLVHALRLRGWRPLLLRGAALGCGGLAPLLLLFGLSRAVDLNFLTGLGRFADTIVQGDFSEGWSLPWRYLWHSEHTLLALWLVGSGLALRRTRSRAWPWLAGALGLYLMLVIGSHLLQRFVVYGRLVRPLIPLLCIAAAMGWWQLRQRLPWKPLLALVALQVALNFLPLLRQVYPAEILADAQRRFPGEVSVALTVTGPELHAPGLEQPARYVVVNHRILTPVHGLAQLDFGPKAIVLRRHPHPLTYIPDQCNGWSATERRLLAEHDFSMRLIDRGHQKTP